MKTGFSSFAVKVPPAVFRQCMCMSHIHVPHVSFRAVPGQCCGQ